MFKMKLGTGATLTERMESMTAITQEQQSFSPPPYQSEPQASEMPYDGSLPSDLPDHFDELIGEAEISLGIKPAPSHAMLSADDFHKVFVGGFNFSHHISGLKSLKVDGNHDAARDASKAIYDTIIDVPMLHFILKPGGKWMERGFAVAAFTFPMAQALNAELAAKRHTPSPGAPAAQTKVSPTPTAPGDPDDMARYTLTGGQ